MTAPLRILIAECMQEISSFNPLPSRHADFSIETGADLLANCGLNTAICGAMSVFEARPDTAVVPAISARAGSAGTLCPAGWNKLYGQILDALAPHAGHVDAIYFSMHGAMGAQNEADPEGALLESLRDMFGPHLPIVISLDLHGILTDRMAHQIDGLAIYHTYPHVDFADTGRRAAQLLLDIFERDLRPVIARVVVPMLARGDECLTKNGHLGEVIAEARLLERQNKALAAGVMIGNPFTDAPELCTQVIVVTENDDGLARFAAAALAGAMWDARQRYLARLIPLDRAVELAAHDSGPDIFTDAADATSSGASGDSNAIICALLAGGYRGSVLAPLVDPNAASMAHRAGVGATITVPLGGAHDRARFTPLQVTAQVESLSRGRARLETSGGLLDAGPTAVLRFENFTVLTMSRAVHLFDRAMYFANGLDPHQFDLTIVKSPHTEFHMYNQWVTRNYNIDGPGATSANLPTLGHQHCARPIYPLELETTFTPSPLIYRRRAPT
jgi:microcystin degradation protein MlrC